MYVYIMSLLCHYGICCWSPADGEIEQCMCFISQWAARVMLTCLSWNSNVECMVRLKYQSWTGYINWVNKSLCELASNVDMCVYAIWRFHGFNNIILVRQKPPKLIQLWSMRLNTHTSGIVHIVGLDERPTVMWKVNWPLRHWCHNINIIYYCYW